MDLAIANKISKTAEEMLNSAKTEVAKLDVLGLEKGAIMDDLYVAYNAYKSRNYRKAMLHAERAKKSAGILKNLYRDTCIALASAGDCLTEARNRSLDITRPLNILKSAKRSFEQSDFEKAFHLAMESAAQTVMYTEGSTTVSVPRPRKKYTNPCKWQYPLIGSGNPFCLNVLGERFRGRCTGDSECKFADEKSEQ